jgi:type VI protein secretion system component Hcp
MANSLVRRWRRAAVAVSMVAALAIAVAVLQRTDAESSAQPQAAPVLAAQNTCPSALEARPVAANTASYARIDGITGDATRTGVAGQVVLTAIRAGLCGGGGTGPSSIDQIVVEKRIDRASVPLNQRAATGTHIATAKFSVWVESGTPREIASYELSDITVAYVRQVQRSDSLTEEAGFAFGRIAWAFTPVNPDGSAGATIRFCWDRARNAAC